MQLYCARQRRRLNRGLRRKQQSLLKRLRKAKKEAPPMEKPEVVKTHLRDMVILPEMVGSMVGVYNGKTFNQVEIKVRCHLSGGRAGVWLHWNLTHCQSHSCEGVWIGAPTMVDNVELWACIFCKEHGQRSYYQCVQEVKSSNCNVTLHLSKNWKGDFAEFPVCVVISLSCQVR